MKKIKFSVKKIKNDSLKNLKLDIGNGGKGFVDLLTEEKKVKEHNNSFVDTLSKINSKIENLQKSANSSQKNIDIDDIIQQFNEIFPLIEKLDSEKISKKNFFIAIDSLITANSSALYYKDALYIENTPYMKRLTIFRREYFAKTVLKHFPYFHGLKIVTESDSKAVSISFDTYSDSKNVQTILNDLNKLIEKLLNWEMQKIGDGMYNEFHLLRQGTVGMIYIEMDVEPIIYDPSS